MRDDAGAPDLTFASDNAGPVHPEIMAGLAAANAGRCLPYGADPWTERAVAAVRALFEAPRAEVLLVPTGIAANALILGTWAKPWSRIFCSEIAHIERDETGAVSLASGGADLAPVTAPQGRVDPDALDARIRAEPPERRGALSLTQVTEAGTVYGLDALAALGEVARAHALPVHLDGARWSNAAIALGCSPAEMVRAAGARALSLGGTKAGLMGAEAAVFLDPSDAAEARIRRQRMGLSLSKSRFPGAQLAAWLEAGLWEEMARSANAAAARLSDGLAARRDVTLVYPTEANMVFARLPRRLHRRLQEAGARYYLDTPDGAPGAGPDDAPIDARFVCDWATDAERVDAFLAALGPEAAPTAGYSESCR